MTLTAAPSPAHQLGRAVALVLAGEGVLTFMDAIIKGLTARYPTFEIAFLRFAFGAPFAIAFFVWSGAALPTRDALRFHSLRAILVVVTASAFFYSLSVLPIAEAMALSFVSPLFVVLFGVMLLKERFTSSIGFALAAGLAGMLVIVSGKLGGGTYTTDTIYGAAAVLLSAVTYAMVVVLLRMRAQVDPIPVIVVLQNVLPALILAPLALLVWTPLALDDAWQFLLVGALGVAGHTCLAEAFKRAEAAALAPLHYTVLVWGILWGWVFFREVPGTMTLLGAALIVVATLIVKRR